MSIGNEWEKYKRKPQQESSNTAETNEWDRYRRIPEARYQPKKSPLPGQGFALGLGQALENKIKGLVSHGAEPEVDMPEFMRHQKLANRPETNRSPSFNLEQYVDPSQHFQFKVGEYAPEIVGGGLALNSGVKALSKLTGKSIGKNIVKDVKELKGAFNKEYNSIFDAAEKRGVKNIDTKASKEDLYKVLGEVDKKTYKGLDKFLQDPTARNAHFAQSDLGKFIRKMQSKRDLTSSEHEALKVARGAQDTLKHELYGALLKEGGLDLPFKYSDVTNRYAKHLIPYLENAPIRKASLNPGQKGYINPKRLPEKMKLETSDPFMQHLRGKQEGSNLPINEYLHGKYPMLELNQILHSPAVKYGLMGAGFGGGYASYRLLESLLGKG